MAEEISKLVVLKIIEEPNSDNQFTWLFETIPNILIKSISPAELAVPLVNPQRGIYLFNMSDFSQAIFDILLRLKEFEPYENILIVSSRHHAVELAELVRQGFNRIFFFPEDQFTLRKCVAELVSQEVLKYNSDILKYQQKQKFDFSAVIGKSKAILDSIEIAKKLSLNSEVSVLIGGETGTGKELFARTIHYNSSRAKEPFIDITCSSIPESLLESELFGFEKGSFTDAKSQKIGLFEVADKGTIFLDEIGDISMTVQSKILKAIENKMIRRIGGVSDRKIYSRIIAATNKDLLHLVDEGKFRLDLYHRLSVVPLELPPLRDRGDDILLLAEKYLEDCNKKFNRNIEGFTRAAKNTLREYFWPGNIRELSHVIERAVLLSNKSYLNEDDIVLGNSIKGQSNHIKQVINLKLNLEEARLQNLEKMLVLEVLNSVQGNKTEASKILGISRPRLDRILGRK